MFVSLKEAGGIYFITFPNCSDFIKIGRASNFSDRFTGLQCANPDSLSVELIFPTSKDNEELNRVEQDFHRAFSAYRCRGEWFTRNGTLNDFIEYRQNQCSRSCCRYTSYTDQQVFGWEIPEDLDNLQDHASLLSKRELETAKLVAMGLSNQEIADRLSIGLETIKSYVAQCLSKLNCNNRVQLAVCIAKQEMACIPDG